MNGTNCTDCITASSVNMFKSKLDTSLDGKSCEILLKE